MTSEDEMVAIRDQMEIGTLLSLIEAIPHVHVIINYSVGLDEFSAAIDGTAFMVSRDGGNGCHSVVGSGATPLLAVRELFNQMTSLKENEFLFWGWHDIGISARYRWDVSSNSFVCIKPGKSQSYRYEEFWVD